MKKLIFLLFLLTSLVCSAENTVIKEGTSPLTKEQMWSNVTKLILSTTDNKFAEYKMLSSDRTLGQIYLELQKECYAGSHWNAIIKMRVCIEMKDNKYRISDMGSTLRFKTGNEYNEISAFSTKYLEDMKLDLQVVQCLFDKDEVNYSDYIYNKKYYGALLSGTPKYLKPKDEKKNKINPTYDKYSRIVKACDEVNETIEDIKKMDGFWLSKALTENSDF